MGGPRVRLEVEDPAGEAAQHRRHVGDAADLAEVLGSVVSRPARPRCQPSTSARARDPGDGGDVGDSRAAAATTAGGQPLGRTGRPARRRRGRAACPGRRAAANARTAARRSRAPGVRLNRQDGTDDRAARASDATRPGRGERRAGRVSARCGLCRAPGGQRSSAHAAWRTRRARRSVRSAPGSPARRRREPGRRRCAGRRRAGTRRSPPAPARRSPRPSARPSRRPCGLGPRRCCTPAARCRCRSPPAPPGSPGHVAHVHEVAPLAAVLEDPRRAPGLQRGPEDRRDAAVRGVPGHAGPVHVVVAQRDHACRRSAGPTPRPGAPGRAWWRRRRCAGRAARPRRPAPASSGSPQAGQARLEPARGQVGDRSRAAGRTGPCAGHV